MRWLFDLLTVAGFILTALGTYLTVKSGVGISLIENEIMLYGGITLIIVTVIAYHYWRQSIIAKSVIKGRSELIKAHLAATQFSNELKESTPKVEKCICEFSNVCQHICIGLARFHDTPISACILYLNQNRREQKTYAKTLSRDIASKDYREQAASIHNDGSISDNTDFNYIFEAIDNTPVDKVYYFNNSIPLNIRYKNSHIHHTWRKKYYSWYGLIPRLFNWKLPYRSAIVVPILPQSTQKKESIEGFLCVDSKSMWVFSKKYDVPVLKELAASLHPALKTFNKKRAQILSNGKKN